jgi:NTP pyrophosphatase (non-canonical NTP hydrolase)
VETHLIEQSFHINCLVRECHTRSKNVGWYNYTTTDTPVVKLALIHSEISEALEGFRKGLHDDKLPHRPMIEVELADAIIRIFDLAGYLGLDLGGAYAEKLLYNETREDHKLEIRALEGGKKF